MMDKLINAPLIIPTILWNFPQILHLIHLSYTIIHRLKRLQILNVYCIICKIYCSMNLTNFQTVAIINHNFNKIISQILSYHQTIITYLLAKIFYLQ